MRTIRLLAIGLSCAAAFSAPVFAQAGAAPALTKIGIINSAAFADEKGGITKFIGAVKALNTEFAPTQAELSTLSTKLDGLAKEIDLYRNQAASGKVPVDEKSAQAKVDEAEKLQRDIKFKQEDAKSRFEKRQQTLLGPVMQEIGKALTDFAKQKGYLIIFDISKDDNGFVIAIGDEKIDVTKDFITFYNGRP